VVLFFQERIELGSFIWIDWIDFAFAGLDFVSQVTKPTKWLTGERGGRTIIVGDGK